LINVVVGVKRGVVPQQNEIVSVTAIAEGSFRLLPHLLARRREPTGPLAGSNFGLQGIPVLRTVAPYFPIRRTVSGAIC
jgi:hypothetical protein